MTADVLALVRRIEETRQRWWLYTLICRLALAGTVSALVLGLVLLFDQVFPYGPRGLVVASLVVVFTSAATLTWALTLTLRQYRTLEAAARRIEASFPELDGKLISLLQLSRLSDPFAQAAARQFLAEVTGRPVEEAANTLPWRDRIRYGLATARDAAGAVGSFVGVCVLMYTVSLILPGWFSSLTRILTPWSFTPHVGAVRILDVSPGDATTLQGKPLRVTVRVAVPESMHDLPDGWLFVTHSGGKAEQISLVADETRKTYVGVIPAVIDELTYYVQIGSTQSPLYRVRVTRPPEIVGVRLRYEYPAYTGRSPETVEQSHGDISGLQYTQVVAEYRASCPIVRGYVETSEGIISGAVTEDRTALRVRFLLLKDTSYTVSVFNELGASNPSPQLYRIRVVPDGAPQVTLLAPRPDSTVASGQTLQIAVEAKDDYGLHKVWCEARVVRPGEGSGEESAARVLTEWRPSGEQETVVRGQFSWELSEQRFPPGTVIYVRAVAEDNRYVEIPGHVVGAQQATTDWVRVTVVAPQERAQAFLELLSDLRARLAKLLRVQLEARLKAAEAGEATAVEFPERAGQTLRLQRQVRADAAQILSDLDEAEEAFTRLVFETLTALHNREMAVALRLAERLAESGGGTEKEAVLPELLAVQDRIIEALNRLLDLNRQLEERALSQAEEKEGGDLPPEPVLEKLRELKEKLNEFLKQQKRVIEASENLAKKPVEDYTDEDLKLLEELAAIEDDWSRFMGETRSDLSKLPEQDFANPSLLEELVEIETELKMAADALTKKTVEIAVPLEQLGAERAEEMTTNIEKWLPDTPDRERWMQEEPLDDMFKSAPMAELPGELEDLVGELMEEEEALFEEMEDISSSWADSLDKGAGWDAMDGPISNMSARGVTGNRLPNNSEIGGRSGEGRQGKAHGEFVSETAVGKGGRKTPTRLTPDPFVEGEIKDTSKDPVGGATGGGKQSGIGGEGLEGPAPARPDVLQRLAEKQAALRNKAEVIDLRLSVSQYHHLDLDDLVERMRQIELDLRAGRLHEALRRRTEVLGQLQDLKRYAGGETETREDRSVTEAKRTDQVAQGVTAEAPPGWEDLTRRYFERLGARTGP